MNYKIDQIVLDLGKLTKPAAVVLCVFILSASGCTMFTSLDDVEVEKAKAVAVKAEAEAEVATTKMQIEALNKLLDRGMDSISARCALYGWNKQNTSDVLMCAGSKGDFTKVIDNGR